MGQGRRSDIVARLRKAANEIAQEGHPGWGNIMLEAAEALTAALATPPDAKTETFQARVHPWLIACFGEAIASDRVERNHRFLEEALELVQSAGCTKTEAIQLVDYVFARPVGEMPQEIGGVMVTLAALCLAWGEDMHAAGEVELTRVWANCEKIRAKQKAKPKHSPLPGSAATPPARDEGVEGQPIEIVVRADSAGVVDARLVRHGDNAQEMAARWGRTEHGNIQGFILTASIPLPPKPQVPTIPAAVQEVER